MTRRLICLVEEPAPASMHLSKLLRAKVWRDSEWDEYRVRFFAVGLDGVEIEHGTDSSYHTDDKGDAIATAEHWCKTTGR